MENVALSVHNQQVRLLILLVLDSPVLKVPGEIPVHLVLLDEMAYLVHLVNREVLAIPDSLESAKIAPLSVEDNLSMIPMTPSLEEERTPCLLPLELLAHLGFLVPLVNKAHLDLLDTKVLLVNPDKLAVLDPLDHQE